MIWFSARISQKQVLLNLAIIAVLSVPLFGQNPYDPVLDGGIMPFQAYDDGNADSVNLATGNLSLHIPLVSFPQRGGKLHADYNIAYNSPAVAQYVCPIIGRPCVWQGAGSGPNLVTVLANIFPQIGTQIAYTCGTACNATYGTVTESDQTHHPMGWINTNGTTSQLRSLDGSGFLATWVNNVSQTVVDRNGVTYYCPTPSSASNPCVATDPSGNQLIFNVDCCAAYGFTDTMGRQIPPVNSGNWTVQGPTGAPLPIKLAAPQ
jgi:hypothetical protein